MQAWKPGVFRPLVIGGREMWVRCVECRKPDRCRDEYNTCIWLNSNDDRCADCVEDYIFAEWAEPGEGDIVQFADGSVCKIVKSHGSCDDCRLPSCKILIRNQCFYRRRQFALEPVPDSDEDKSAAERHKLMDPTLRSE